SFVEETEVNRIVTPTEGAGRVFIIAKATGRLRASRVSARLWAGPFLPIISWRQVPMSRFIFRALGFLTIVAGGMLTMRLNAQDRPATPQNPKAPAMNSEFQLTDPFKHEN